MIFYESSLGYSNAYSFGKMYKTYHFVCFFNLLANVQILPRHFLPVFVMVGVYDQLTPLARAIELFSFGGTKI